MPFGGENAESYYDEGLTAAMKGDMDAALGHFSKALQMDPSLGAAAYQIGRCQLRLGQSQKAVQTLAGVLTRMPRMTAARTELAYAHLLMNHVEGARKLFGEALDEKADQPAAVLGLGYCAFQQAQWDTAMALADRVMGGSGAERFEALYLSARAAHMLKLRDIAANRLQAADELLNQIIETSPGQPEGFYLRGQIHFLLGDYVKSLDNFRSAETRALPDRHYCAYHEHFELLDVLAGQGWCMRQVGNEAGAKEIGKRILEIRPNSKRGRRLAGDTAAE
jgi:tetratricopeptide (TPR) repeat protein